MNQRRTMYPPELKYTKEHEWARIEGKVATIGVTFFAQDSLGDVVFIDVPAAGTEVKQFAKFGEIESVKAVSDLYAPISGEVVAVNENLLQQPELVNQAAFGAGWMVGVRLTNAAELDGLMEYAGYTAYLAGLSH